VDDEAGVMVRRRPVKRLTALALLLLVLLALLVLWTQRKPIAADFIDRELARRDVRATYEVKRIGFRIQRFENLVIGDPRRPDLTAQWVEVRLRWRLGTPRVTLIRARGVRLNARLAGGRIGFGELDRLLPPPSGLPFRLPDQAVDVADATVRFDTPAGRIGLALEGRGNLADGFRGRMAAAAPALRLGSCRLDSVKGRWAVGVADLKPRFQGPARLAGLACGDRLAVNDIRVDLDTVLAPGLDSWNGNGVVRAARLRAGRTSLAGLSGRVGLDGDARMTRGALSLAAAGARVADLTAARAAIDGRYGLSLANGGFTLLGDATLRGASAKAPLAGVVATLASAGGTPVEPVADALAASLARAAAAFDARAALRLVNGRGFGGVRFERLAAVSRSGARVALGGGRGLTVYSPSGLARLDGALSVVGGGFPEMRLALDQAGPGAPIRGVGRIQPMRVGESRLALGDISFTAAPGGETRIETLATIDGPVGGGWVRGLVLPIAGRLDGLGGFAFGERCVAARFEALRVGTFRLGRTPLPLCPTGRALVWKAPGGPIAGGAELRAPRFAGMLGASPLSVAGSRLSFGLAGPGFAASDLAVRLAENRFDLASLTGDFGAKGAVSGRFAGLSGKLANVPLRIGRGSGTWRSTGADLTLAGEVRVSDEMDPPRFYPLVSRDFRLNLADNRIRAGGWLDDPETGTRIVRADIEHGLATGRGRARLGVPGIRFDKDYQPEQLTRLTTGVVALVDGILKGEGEISWDEAGTHSSGTFATDDMDFAAAFGPVEGFSTRLHFTDLLGLVSAPGQEARVDLVRAGIDVLDGRIRYHLLPGLRVRVEGGRWPFCGGELILEETVLDFSKPSAKRLTFRVEGLDAALFIQKMEFANITATGTFDGIIPMVFDERGGRIVGGHLVARPQGGTLSYIGELTDKDLGVYGKLAFDALKSLRYSKLVVDLDGSLEGEFVAAIELDGVARDPALTVAPGGGIKGMVAGRALGQLARIPFEFNIGVRGPFRTLIGTMRSLHDPTLLIQTTLPDLIRGAPAPPPPVQPQESEIVR